MQPPRKPPQKVVAIKGSREADVLHDEDFRVISDLQAASWHAERAVQDAVSGLETRILHGARVEAKNWYFDPELRMVRSRKRGEVSS